MAYILDSKDPNEDRDNELAQLVGNGDQTKLSEHSINCGLMRSLFEKGLDCEVQNVSFPKKSRKGDFLSYWDEQLADKDESSLIIIYYHGNAGGNGENYEWSVVPPITEENKANVR